MPVLYRDKATLDKMRPRIEKDVYQTDPALALAAVKWLERTEPGHPIWRRVLDPGAGAGAWGQAVRQVLGPDALITGLELRDVTPAWGYNRWLGQRDFRDHRSRSGYDLIVGNPPFKLAEAFIRNALTMLTPAGVLMFLLPSDFSHGQGRARGLFRTNPPDRKADLAQRTQFTGPEGESLGNRNTDTYILMVWHKVSGPICVNHWLDWKPA